MTKNLILLRGLPGAGKTTLAQIISNKIFEADQYFINPINGIYEFNSLKLKNAHSWCFDQVKNAMKNNDSIIVVSNTFSQEWEFKNYFDLAFIYGYKVISLIVENRHGNTSIHDVPNETIEKMRNRFNIKL